MGLVSTGMGDCLRVGKQATQANSAAYPQLDRKWAPATVWLLGSKGTHGLFHLWMLVWMAGKTDRFRDIYRTLFASQYRMLTVNSSLTFGPYSAYILPSVIWCCWLRGRKGIRPVKNWVVGMLAWLSVWVKVQICIWPSWCHGNALCFAPLSPDWFYLSGTGSPG